MKQPLFLIAMCGWLVACQPAQKSTDNGAPGTENQTQPQQQAEQSDVTKSENSVPVNTKVLSDMSLQQGHKFAINGGWFTAEQAMLKQGTRVFDTQINQPAVVNGSLVVVLADGVQWSSLATEQPIAQGSAEQLNDKVYRINFTKETDLYAVYKTVSELPLIEKHELEVTYINPVMGF